MRMAIPRGGMARATDDDFTPSLWPCHCGRDAARGHALGGVIGMVSGLIRWLDAIIMRIVDGLMAIPGVLLAIAMMSLKNAAIRPPQDQA